MIEMSFKTFTIKVLLFILSNLLSCWIRGRHSTTKCSQIQCINIHVSIEQCIPIFLSVFG